MSRGGAKGLEHRGMVDQELGLDDSAILYRPEMGDGDMESRAVGKHLSEPYLVRMKRDLKRLQKHFPEATVAELTGTRLIG